MAISNFGWAWKGPQILQLLPALTFLREASSLLQPAFTFPSVTFHSRCPDGPQRVSPHWLGWCPCPCPRPGVTSGEPTSTLGPAEAVPGRPEAAGSMRRALYADWEAPGRPGPGSDIWDLGAGREACETSCGALLSSLAPPPAKPAWAQSPPGGDDGHQMSQRLLGLQVQKQVKGQTCRFLAEDLQLTPGRWFVDFPCVSSHFRSEHFFCCLSRHCPDRLPFWLSASQPHKALQWVERG